MSTTEHGGSYIKVNRLKDSWTWNVQVAADDNTPEALKDAKEKALAIARELNDALNPAIVEQAEEEIPF